MHCSNWTKIQVKNLAERKRSSVLTCASDNSSNTSSKMILKGFLEHLSPIRCRFLISRARSQWLTLTFPKPNCTNCLNLGLTTSEQIWRSLRWASWTFRLRLLHEQFHLIQVWVGLTFDTLQVVGRYRMSSWFSTSSGDFNVTLITVNAEGFAGLDVDADGTLQVSNITFDVGFKDITMKFDNLGFFGSLFQVRKYSSTFLKCILNNLLFF